MTALPWIHLAATAGFCTLLWLVQLVIYPQLAAVRREDFHAHHDRHMRAITWIVAPLFFLEGGAAALSFWFDWRSAPWLHGASILLFVANSALTFLWFVPAHTALAIDGRDEQQLRKLIAMNAWRTALSSVRLGVVFALISSSE